MGNRICRKSTVEERFTRPQRLVRAPSNVDYKTLRKLILSQKLAPCFDGIEESNNPDHEECPICFFYYPSLNRSRCCTKGICTECFWQIRPSNAMHSLQCPFCKTPSYTVEYRGARTQEEKDLEQAEEQRVIEAKIRMQLLESQNSDQVIVNNWNSSSLGVQSSVIGSRELSNGRLPDIENRDLSLVGQGIQVAGSPGSVWERYDEFGVDLEDIMMMEAIWQSIKDTRLLEGTAQQSLGSIDTASDCHVSNQTGSYLALVGQAAVPSDSVTGGVAVAIARLAHENNFRSEMSQPIQDLSQAYQYQYENAIGHHSCIPSNTYCDADIPIRSDLEQEFDDTESENCCLESSCSATEDDSWGSFSAYPLNGSQHSSDGFISDEDLTAEMVSDDESSCVSSPHTISDSSYGSLNSL